MRSTRARRRGVARLALAWLAAACSEPGMQVAAVAGPLPADVREVVYTHCVGCHAEIPFYGAPMSLTRAEHFHSPAYGDPERAVHALVTERIRDDARPMPPWPYVRLDAHEMATLDAWIADGAPAALDDDARDAGAPPRVELPEPDASDAAAGCDFVAELRAHREPTNDDQTPFAIEGETDRLECFVLSAPWTGAAHALRIEPIIESPEIVHHASIGVIESPTEFTSPGKVSPCRGDQDPVSYALSFWLPGAGPIAMPDDVGYLLPDEQALLLLQVHYSSRGGSYQDRSGFRVCGTYERRPHEAQLHWLGNETIAIPAGESASYGSECTVRGEDPVHVLSVLPHMHLAGRRMTIERLGSDGSAELLHDHAFAFLEQRIYPTDWVIAPGETLRTTCHYENTADEPVVFGQRTIDEMCYAFVVAYPAGRLSDMQIGMKHQGCITR